MDTLIEHGEQIAQDSLKKNPDKMITLMNALSNLSNAGLAREKRAARLKLSTLSSELSTAPSETNRTPKK